jgi:hypothetical protein
MSLRLTVGRVLLATAAMALPFASLAQDPSAVTTVELRGLHSVFGEHVRDLNGDDAGRLWDILVDDSAHPEAAVISYGGTLGVGERKVAVAWDKLQFVPQDAQTPIHLALTKQQLGTLPEFKYGTGIAVVGDGQ